MKAKPVGDIKSGNVDKLSKKVTNNPLWFWNSVLFHFTRYYLQAVVLKFIRNGGCYLKARFSGLKHHVSVKTDTYFFYIYKHLGNILPLISCCTSPILYYFCSLIFFLNSYSLLWVFVQYLFKMLFNILPVLKI